MYIFLAIEEISYHIIHDKHRLGMHIVCGEEWTDIRPAALHILQPAWLSRAKEENHNQGKYKKITYNKVTSLGKNLFTNWSHFPDIFVTTGSKNKL